jgi:hypothetical protein
MTAVLASLLATGAAASPGAIVARRAEGRVRVDGRLDDAAWAAAPAFSAFVESFPRPGAAPSLRTEVRVLYDDEALYVGVSCFDPEPAAIVRQLARRDSEPASDRIEIALDTDANRHSAYDFIVNAAGVLRDQLLFADVNSRDSWDAVWDAAVSHDERGWSAEVAIPFRQLRFSDAPEQRWGILVRRHVPRTHQVFDSALITRDANHVKAGNLVVSRFGRLEGLVDVRPRRGLELLPYVAARTTLRPQFSAPERPTPRLADPALDVGLDFRTALGRRLMLTGAINPDFGQVETDQVIQNLSNAEPFFAEKRPFFMEGLDIFEPVGAEYGTPQQLFYSRRIGLDAPILGAAKVTGSARDGFGVGVLDSVVMGAGNASLVPIGYGDPGPDALAPFEENPDRRWRFRPRQPFHFGPESGLPQVAPVTTNYFAGVARQRIGRSSAAGVIVTAATPLEPRCTRGEFATEEEYAAGGCEARGGNALGLDLSVPGVWGGFAQAEVSQAVGGPKEGYTLADGTVIRPGDLGFGGHMRAGKLGGEPWRFEVQYVFEDAKLDLNHVGFQPLSNYQWADLVLGYVRPNGLGDLHSFKVDYVLDVNWTADGRWLPRGINTFVFSEAQLPSFHTIGARVGVEIAQYDTREIDRAGVPFERQGNAFLTLVYATDPSRRLQASGDVFVFRTLHEAAFESRFGGGIDLNLTWRPHPRLETRLDTAYGFKPQGPRWIETLEDDTAVFGEQDALLLSTTLRQQLVFTPRLTAQLYAQLFSSALRFHDGFYGASLQGRRHLAMADLVPVDYSKDPSSHDAVVNLNAVLRWEYRLGSTMYVVYTRSQSEFPAVEGRASRSIAPSDLFRGPTIESLLVKLSYWWDR